MGGVDPTNADCIVFATLCSKLIRSFDRLNELRTLKQLNCSPASYRRQRDRESEPRDRCCSSFTHRAPQRRTGLWRSSTDWVTAGAAVLCDPLPNVHHRPGQYRGDSCYRRGGRRDQIGYEIEMPVRCMISLGNGHISSRARPTKPVPRSALCHRVAPARPRRAQASVRCSFCSRATSGHRACESSRRNDCMVIGQRSYCRYRASDGSPLTRLSHGPRQYQTSKGVRPTLLLFSLVVAMTASVVCCYCGQHPRTQLPGRRGAAPGREQRSLTPIRGSPIIGHEFSRPCRR